MFVARWAGPPFPEACVPEDGFEWEYRDLASKRGMRPPGSGFAPSYPSGRFCTLTTVFPHPADRPPPSSQEDPHLMQRFLDDQRRRPPHAYVKGNMLWRKGVARSLSPCECEQLMGLPIGATKDLKPAKGSDAVSARLHAIGNGFHLPSVMMIIAIMLAGLPVGAKADVHPIFCGDRPPGCCHRLVSDTPPPGCPAPGADLTSPRPPTSSIRRSVCSRAATL